MLSTRAVKPRQTASSQRSATSSVDKHINKEARLASPLEVFASLFRSRPQNFYRCALIIALAGIAAPITGCTALAQILGNLIPSGGGFTPTTTNTTTGPPYPRKTVWRNFLVGNGFSGPNLVATADFNLDGRPDILCSFSGSNVQTPSLVIFFQVFQNGTISFTGTTISRSNSLASIGGLAIGDINADGRPDVVAAANGQIFFLRAPTDPTVGNQWQTFTIAQSNQSGIGQWHQVALAQIDNLFGPDIVCANDTPGQLSVFFAPQLINGPNNLTGTGWTRFDIDATTRAGAFGCVTNDVDGDGRMDVVSSAPTEANARIAWYKNPGGNATATWQKFTIGNARGVTKLEMGDLNQDGPKDVVGMNPLQRSGQNSNDGIQLVWYQRPTDVTTPWTGFVLAQFISNTPIDFAITDVEANGRPDVVAATNNSNTLRWFSRRDNVTQTWVENNITDLSQTPTGISIADIDLNARPDVVANLITTNDLVNWYVNPN